MNIDESIRLAKKLEKCFQDDLRKEEAENPKLRSAKAASLGRSICDINYVITELYVRKGMITHAGNKSR